MRRTRISKKRGNRKDRKMTIKKRKREVEGRNGRIYMLFKLRKKIGGCWRTEIKSRDT